MTIALCSATYKCLPTQDRNVYETTKSVNEYMAFHYTPPSEYIAQPFCPKEHLDFPLRCAELCIKHKNVCSVHCMSMICHLSCYVFKAIESSSTNTDHGKQLH